MRSHPMTMGPASTRLRPLSCTIQGERTGLMSFLSGGKKEQLPSPKLQPLADVEKCCFCCNLFLLLGRKRRCSDGQGANEPYIKKPLNAFMIFRKEERENVMAEVKITDSATVNSILGRRVSASASAPTHKSDLTHIRKHPTGQTHQTRQGFDRSRVEPKSGTGTILETLNIAEKVCKIKT